jgi:hypothetical protein
MSRRRSNAGILMNRDLDERCILCTAHRGRSKAPLSSGAIYPDGDCDRLLQSRTNSSTFVRYCSVIPPLDRLRSIARSVSVCACASFTVATAYVRVDAAPILVSDRADRAAQIAQAVPYKVGDRVEVMLSGTRWDRATIVKVTPGAPNPYEVRIDGEAWTRVAWNEVIRPPAGGQQQGQRQPPAQRDAGPATPAPIHAMAPPATARKPAAGDGLCRVGQRVEAADGGRWYQSVVIDVRPATTPFNGTMIEQRYRCRTHPIGYESTMDSWKPVSFLRPVGTGRAEPIPGGAKASDATLDSIRRRGAAAPASAGVATGHYACVTFLNGMLVSNGDLTITGAGSYTAAGAAGTYTYNPQTSLLQFRGAGFGGQTADYENRARPTIHIHGRSGNRIMDCERGS